VARIEEVGFAATAGRGWLNPPPLLETVEGLRREWPDRFTTIISVPGMKSVTDANIVVDAIAYSRLGGDDPRVAVYPENKKLVATYNALHVADKNIEFAIAGVGFDANRIPARLGAADSVPNGWNPVILP